MPVHYSFEGNLFCMTFEGSYTAEDTMSAFTAALEDALFPEDARFLMDVRSSAMLAARSPEQIRAIVEFLMADADRIGRRCAVVVESPVQYGLSRMGAAFAEPGGVEAEVFSNVKDAKAWLGVTNE